jgi:hypothetical protein
MHLYVFVGTCSLIAGSTGVGRLFPPGMRQAPGISSSLSSPWHNTPLFIGVSGVYLNLIETRTITYLFYL